MIIREKEPANLEMTFSSLESRITPNEQFYVRSHFPVPEVDLAAWRLTIVGAVAQQREFSLDELRALPKRTIEATIECAGNGRVFLVPKAKGVQWELGAIGNAQWTGVLLRDVLAPLELRDAVSHIVLEGADRGRIAEPPRPAGEIHFARSIPREKAFDDVLLAYEMNGAPLSPAHGFPLRAIVPGWYGMASIKWLQRVVVLDRQFDGYYETVDYGYWRQEPAGPVLLPLREMQVKSQIARPAMGEQVRAGSQCRITGAAWTSDAEIARVEITADEGRTWREATLLGDPVRNAWRLWQIDWQAPQARGNCTLRSRATDSLGRSQPMQHDGNSGSYMINFCLPIEIEVV
jgi:DMSO/TMAO reductase YedYZ molybdopterin-dependent catalytic subunit